MKSIETTMELSKITTFAEQCFNHKKKKKIFV